MPRLIFAGEAIVDVVLRVPALPDRGGDVLASSAEVTVGGGFNVMAAAARQGLPVLYAGGHGTGPWGDLVRAALAAEGMTVLRPPDPGRDTGFDVALVEPDGERTFATHIGAETLEAWDDLPAGPGDFVYVSGYGLAAGSVISPLAPGSQLFVDPGPLAAQIPADVLDPVLSRCDWLSCNQREASLLTGSDDPVAAARLLLRRTGRASVIVRTGPAGCVLALRGHEPARVPAPAVKVVDTTGAGDTHAGVFIAALADGLDAARAAARANAGAAFSVTRPGPATGPARDVLDAWQAEIGNSSAPPQHPTTRSTRLARRRRPRRSQARSPDR